MHTQPLQREGDDDEDTADIDKEDTKPMDDEKEENES